MVAGNVTPENNKTATVYGVTNVTYDTSNRVCKPANTFYTAYAYISTNGPVTVTYIWQQSDGNNSGKYTLTFTEASTEATVPRKWSQGIASSHTTRWVRIVVTSPTYQEFSKAILPDLCY